MANTSKEQMDEAIARAKKDVADEVQEHQAEDQDLENVAGGVAGGGGATTTGGDAGGVISNPGTLWEVGVIYKT